MKWFRALAVVGLVLGCTSTLAGPYSPAGESARSTVEAQRLNLEAADLIASDPAAAEALLRESLARDLFFGPAHNNLGVLYLKEGKLYEAAGEFEWARKLMPGHPDPRLNLAITLEKAGQTDEAIQAYEAALEVYPGHLGSMQGLACLRARRGERSEELREMLAAIRLQGESDAWRSWAQAQLVGLPKR
jgi:Tfp pilus assembly protein PilF